MFGIPDKDGFKTYPDSNIHRGDQIRGFGFQNNGAMDTLVNYLQGEVFASDKYQDVGFKTQKGVWRRICWSLKMIWHPFKIILFILNKI